MSLVDKEERGGFWIVLVMGMLALCMLVSCVWMWQPSDWLANQIADRRQLWSARIDETTRSITAQKRELLLLKNMLKHEEFTKDEMAKLVEEVALHKAHEPNEETIYHGDNVELHPLTVGVGFCFVPECGCPSRYRDVWCDDTTARGVSSWCHRGHDACQQCHPNQHVNWCDKNGPVNSTVPGAFASHVHATTKHRHGPTLRRRNGQVYVVESDGREFVATLVPLPEGKFSAEYTYIDESGRPETRTLRFRKKGGR